MSDFTCNESKTTLTEAMSQAWQTEKRHIIITGDGGAGKSTLLASTFLQLVSSDTVVPLYFDLSGDLSGMSEKETIQHRLITDYCGQLENETSSQALYKLFSGGGALPAPKFVFLIDGINESEAPGQYITEIISNLLEYDSVQVVMASRYFLPELVKYCCEYRISPLSKEQVSKVFESSHISIEDLPDGIRSLMNRPLFLTMYIKEWAEKGLTAAEQLINTAGEFFNAHFDRLINKKSQTVDSYPRAEFALRYLLPAMTLFLSYEFSWYHFCEVLNDTHPKVKDRYDAFEEIHSFSGKAAELLILLKNKGIISDTTKKNTYRFRHAYYREFLQAMYACNEMERAVNGATDEPMPLLPFEQKHRMSEGMIRWIGEILGEHHHAGKKTITERFIKLSPPLFNGNSVEILKQSHGRKLKIDFNGLSLFDVRLYDVDLKGSSFKGTKSLTVESFLPLEIGSPLISPDGFVVVSEQRGKLLFQIQYLYTPFTVDLITSFQFPHFIDDNKLLYLDEPFIFIISPHEKLGKNTSEASLFATPDKSFKRGYFLSNRSLSSIIDIHCNNDTTVLAILYPDHVEFIDTISNSTLRFSLSVDANAKVVVLGNVHSRLVSVIGKENGELLILQPEFSSENISLISTLRISPWVETERLNRFVVVGDDNLLIESVPNSTAYSPSYTDTRLHALDINKKSLQTLQNSILSNTSSYESSTGSIVYMSYRSGVGCFFHRLQLRTGQCHSEFIGEFQPILSNGTHCIIDASDGAINTNTQGHSTYYTYYLYSLIERRYLYWLEEPSYLPLQTEPFAISKSGNWVAVTLESQNFVKIKVINRENYQAFTIDIGFPQADKYLYVLHIRFVDDHYLLVDRTHPWDREQAIIELDNTHSPVKWHGHMTSEWAENTIESIFGTFKEELSSIRLSDSDDSPSSDLHDLPSPFLLIRGSKARSRMRKLLHQLAYNSSLNSSVCLPYLFGGLRKETPSMVTVASHNGHVLVMACNSLAYHNQKTGEFVVLDKGINDAIVINHQNCKCWFGEKERLIAILCDMSLQIWSIDTAKLLANITRIPQSFPSKVVSIRLIGCSPDCLRFYFEFHLDDAFDLRYTHIGRLFGVVYVDYEAPYPSKDYYLLDLPVSNNGVAMSTNKDKITLFNCFSGKVIDEITPLVSDVSGCDFRGAEIDGELKRVLRQNGAIVDPE